MAKSMSTASNHWINLKLELPPFKVGDVVTSKFYMNDRNIPRVVKSVTKQRASETGWMINTDSDKGSLYADSNWFKKVEDKK